MSLELANAMILSSHICAEIELPLGRERYAEVLAHLRKEGAVVGEQTIN